MNRCPQCDAVVEPDEAARVARVVDGWLYPGSTRSGLPEIPEGPLIDYCARCLVSAVAKAAGYRAVQA